MNLSEILNHLGENRSEYYQAVSPPVMQSSNFVFPDLEAFRMAFSDELAAHLYTRGNNPTVKILREKLAALEETEDCLVFGSGAGAIAAAIIGNVQAGDHVICQKSPYTWTRVLLESFLSRFGVEHTFVDASDLNEIDNAYTSNTRVLYLESPNSLTFEIQDLKACADWARERGIITMIDNSYSTPVFQRPSRFGIDIVLHSGTKYLNGHSDVVVGVLCASKEMVKKIFDSEFMTLGSIISPHDASLVIRGLRTLPIRMEQSDRGARYILSKLEKHPKVAKIYFPFHKDFPQKELAEKQMSGCGGLFSVEFVDSPKANMEAFVHKLNRFAMAVSWGGHESLIIPTVGFYDIPGKKDPELPWTFCRFYIGLEDPEWLWEDLEQALVEI